MFKNSVRKIDSFNVSFNKRFNGIEFNIPQIKLAEPIRVQRVKALNPQRRNRASQQQDQLFQDQ